MQNIAQSEYDKEIQSLAREIWDDALEQADNDRVVVGGVRRSAHISPSNLSDDKMRHAKSGSRWKEDAHYLSALAHGYVADHLWINDSDYYMSVTECSDNPDAYQDNYDDTELVQFVAEGGVSKLYQIMAHWAMHTDVSNAVYGLAEEEFYNEQFSR
jgi:hypothetical protein